MTRALRAMFVANDGFSAGHVARTLAVARALARRAKERALATSLVVATTSEADALLATAPFAIVRLPAPVAARRAGLSDTERRGLVRGCLEAAATSFAPDVLVADTFPCGPHGELAFATRARRVLVRRHVPEGRTRDPALADRLDAYDLAILVADPHPLATKPPVRHVHVAPITGFEAEALSSKATARAALGLHPEARVVLVACGGGGDTEAIARATRLAEAIVAVDSSVVVAFAGGPLADRGRAIAPRERVVPIVAAPLAPHMTAFDGAFAAAGYNTAHELARARVPAVLYACPRPFDDQAARAERFAASGFAHVLADDGDAAIAAGLAWMTSAPRPHLPEGGATSAADAILDLVTGGAT